MNKYEFLKEAQEKSARAYAYWKENYENADEDVNFIYGNQYDADELADLQDDDRIALTFNKLPQFINNIIGAQRSVTQTIKVTPTGRSLGVEEPQFTTQKENTIKLSQVLSDLIRDIEYQSKAEQWYQTIFKHAVEGGFGFLRVFPKYQDDGFDQDIVIKGVRDRWSVLIDPSAKNPDRSDMNYAFIFQEMQKDEFKAKYGNKSIEMLSGVNTETTLWMQGEKVIVAEYFRRVPIKRELLLFNNGETHYLDEVEDVLDELEKQGMSVVKKRKIMTHKVMWSKISAGDILDPEQEMPCSTIPIVPIFGRETDMKDKIRTKGLISDAKDAQKAYNRMRSASLERIDVSPLSPFIASDKSIQGYENMWKTANSTKWSTLVYKAGQQPPMREQGASMPVAELQMGSAMDVDIKDAVGMQNASLGQTSNEVSGRAILARQSSANTANFEFIDNYNRALERIGLILVEMIPKIYDTQRIVRLRGADGATDAVMLNQTIKDTQTGEDVVIHNLNYGKHTVVIETGADYKTKREETAEQILNLMKVSPQIAEVGSDILARNLNFPESNVLAERLEKTIPMHLLSKEKQQEIQKDMPPPQPSPEQIKAQSDAQKQQLDVQTKEMEYQYKLEIERVKLQIAEVNLQAQEIAAHLNVTQPQEIPMQEKQGSQEPQTAPQQNPQQGEPQEEDPEDKQKKDKIAKQIAEKIMQNKASENMV